MLKKKILVLTATLGNRESIATTIESVKNIGGSIVKHVIIAPNSKIKNLKNKFPELEIVSEPENCKSIYQALNFGFQQFGREYDYLTFINDDDYWLPNFSLLIEGIVDNSYIDVIYGRTIYVDKDGNYIGKQTCSPRYKAFKDLLSNQIVLFTQQATIFKRKVFFDQNGFDENFRLIADSKFWLQAIEAKCRLKYVNEYCAAYRIQEGQLSSDGCQQSKERTQLQLKTNKLKTFIETILFRFYNVNVYFERILLHKNIRRMSSFFHN